MGWSLVGSVFWELHVRKRKKAGSKWRSFDWLAASSFRFLLSRHFIPPNLNLNIVSSNTYTPTGLPRKTDHTTSTWQKALKASRKVRFFVSCFPLHSRRRAVRDAPSLPTSQSTTTKLLRPNLASVGFINLSLFDFSQRTARLDGMTCLPQSSQSSCLAPFSHCLEGNNVGSGASG